MGGIRETILGADDLQSEVFHSDLWNVDIEVRVMTLGAKDAFERAISNEKGKLDEQKFPVALVVATCFDPETNEPVFTPDDYEALREKNATEMLRLIRAAMDLHGYTGAIEDDVKNGSSAGTEN
jgi:hypothetical protein